MMKTKDFGQNTNQDFGQNTNQIENEIERLKSDLKGNALRSRNRKNNDQFLKTKYNLFRLKNNKTNEKKDANELRLYTENIIYV